MSVEMQHTYTFTAAMTHSKMVSTAWYMPAHPLQISRHDSPKQPTVIRCANALVRRVTIFSPAIASMCPDYGVGATGK